MNAKHNLFELRTPRIKLDGNVVLPNSTRQMFDEAIGAMRFHKTIVGDACQLWLMPDWQAKLQRFGSNSLWQATYREFAAAYAAIRPPPAAQPLAAQMKLHGLALEQEAVWLTV